MDTNYNIQYVYPQTIILYDCTQNSELRTQNSEFYLT